MVICCDDREVARAALWGLRSAVLLACSLAATLSAAHDGTANSSDTAQKAIARAAQFESLTELAFAMTNGLKTKFQCEQVVMGKVVGDGVKIVSMSSLDVLYPRSPGSRLIRQAMEECLDAGHRICSKPRGEWSGAGHGGDYRLHRQWRAALGDAAVASIPLFCGATCVAILSLVRPGRVGFRSDELEEIEQLAGVYGPAIHLVERASRSWSARTRDALHTQLARLLAPQRPGRRVVAVAAVALVAWFCVGTIPYTISVPCLVAPSHVQHFAAPFEGVVASAQVEAGDEVRSGQLLFAMDTRELDLQRRELESEAAVCTLEITQQIAAEQVAAAAQAQARLDVLRARLAGVTARLALAEVRAPAAGTILAGDVKKHVGDVVPVGRSLLEFAPHTQWELELRVEGRHGGVVRPGQPGRFVTLAQPGNAVACRVDRVEPAAQIVNGRQVFVAHARLDDHATWNLAGMEGVARLEIGARRVWWVALHRLIDYVRFHFWF
jgi:multidrug efflux pump subunit AcrA (membrane-fusion protein)